MTWLEVRWPAPEGMLWTDDAADNLIGQTFRWTATDSQGEVLLATVADGGRSMILGLEIEEQATTSPDY